MAAGAPKGNQNAVKAKKWTDAIERALEKRSRIDQKAALDELAETFLQKCAEGDLQALKELGDRLEGKPGQSIDMKIKDVTHEEALQALEDD